MVAATFLKGDKTHVQIFSFGDRKLNVPVIPHEPSLEEGSLESPSKDVKKSKSKKEGEKTDEKNVERRSKAKKEIEKGKKKDLEQGKPKKKKKAKLEDDFKESIHDGIVTSLYYDQGFLLAGFGDGRIVFLSNYNVRFFSGH